MISIEDNMSYYVKLRAIPYLFFYLIFLYPAPFVIYYFMDPFNYYELGIDLEILVFLYWFLIFVIPIYFMTTRFGREIELDNDGNLVVYSVKKKKMLEYSNIKSVKIYYKKNKIHKIAFILFLGRDFVIYRKNSSFISFIAREVLNKLDDKAYYVE